MADCVCLLNRYRGNSITGSNPVLSAKFNLEIKMQKDTKEMLLAFGILIVDLIVIGIPLGACLLTYVLIFKPKWFKEKVDEVYREEKK